MKLTVVNSGQVPGEPWVVLGIGGVTVLAKEARLLAASQKSTHTHTHSHSQHITVDIHAAILERITNNFSSAGLTSPVGSWSQCISSSWDREPSGHPIARQPEPFFFFFLVGGCLS